MGIIPQWRFPLGLGTIAGMSIELLFWVIYLMALIFSIWGDWPTAPGPAGFRPMGKGVLFFVLIGLLGWATFGAAIHK